MSRHCSKGLLIIPGESEENDKIVLVRRLCPSGKSLWSLPGGKQKGSELPEATMTREIFEELGIHVRPEDWEIFSVVEKKKFCLYVYVFRLPGDFQVSDLSFFDHGRKFEVNLFNSGDRSLKRKMYSEYYCLLRNWMGAAYKKTL